MALILKKQRTEERDKALKEVAAKIEEFDPTLDIREPDPDSVFFFADGFKCCCMTVPYFRSLAGKLREEILAADFVNLLEV